MNKNEPTLLTYDEWLPYKKTESIDQVLKRYAWFKDYMAKIKKDVCAKEE